MEPSPEPSNPESSAPESSGSSCLTTTDALLIDGANGVCDLRRASGEPLGAAFFGWVALLLVGLVLLRTPRLRSGLFVGLAIAALPGAYAMAFLRADRPSVVQATAAEIARLHDTVRAFGAQHSCAVITRDDCLACQPVVALARIDQSCASPASIDVHADALATGCTAHGALLVCGTPP